MIESLENNFKFTVCMAVYKNDNPEYFRTAVRSIYNSQTIKPAEIIIVVDGPVSKETEEVLEDLKLEISLISLVIFPKNLGHAAARQAGLEAAKNNWIAVMDADDIAVPDRFEKQISILSQNPNLSVIGGQIKEFINTPDNFVGERIVPLETYKIKKYLKARCPMNFMTVMYKKSDVQRVGGFIDWHNNEDYYLWIRMCEAGCRFANLPDTLVHVRVGKEMYARRGGWKYFKSEKGLQDYMLSHKIISLPRYMFNVAVRFGVQVAMPNKVRGYIFQKLFRK